MHIMKIAYKTANLWQITWVNNQAPQRWLESLLREWRIHRKEMNIFEVAIQYTFKSKSQSIRSTNSSWWCTKSSMSWLSTRAVIGGTWRIKGEELTKNTNGMPAKDPLKVKLLLKWSLITLKVYELGNFTNLGEEKFSCLYSGTELIKIPWA